MLFATAGMMLLVSAGSLVMVYLGLEMLALCSYALVAIDRDSPLASEAAMKYFVLGSLASGLLLYGLSLIYGATGTLRPRPDRTPRRRGRRRLVAAADHRRGVPGRRHRLQVRRRAVPHVAAGRLPRRADADHAVHRLGAEAGRVRHDLPPARSRRGPLDDQWRLLLAGIAVLSLAIGNLIAMAQSNLKRLLAYSTVSHVGFLFLGLAGGGRAGLSPRRCSTRSATRSCRRRPSARSWCCRAAASRPTTSTTSRASTRAARGWPAWCCA